LLSFSCSLISPGAGAEIGLRCLILNVSELRAYSAGRWHERRMLGRSVISITQFGSICELLTLLFFAGIFTTIHLRAIDPERRPSRRSCS
jgi:hypothetical protein